MAGKYGYDPNVDYQALINEAVKNGDMARAAIYEQQRNEKISGTGMQGVTPSNNYSAWLPGQTQTYTNPWKEELDKAIAGMTDTEKYRQTYLAEADKTMQDTLGKYAGMTGSVPSTAAVAAASQAADAAKAQVDARIMDLNRENAGLLMQAGSQSMNEYQMRIQNAMNRWSTMGYADKDVAEVLGVPIGTSTADQAYQRWYQGQQVWQNQYTVQQQEKTDAYNYAVMLINAGIAPDAATLAKAGITQEVADSLLAKVNGTNGKGSYTKPPEVITEMPEKDFSRMMSGIIEYINLGNFDGANNLLNANWNKMTAGQREKVMDAITGG